MRAEETPQHFVEIAKKQVAQERPTGQVVERTQDFILPLQELLVSSKFQSGARCVCSNAPPSPRSAASNASTSRSSTCPLRIGRRRSLALLGSLSRPRAKISCRRRLFEKLPPERRRERTRSQSLRQSSQQSQVRNTAPPERWGVSWGHA